jgi:hypothetical protein
VRATGVPWQLAGPGSWSYYRRAGHYLGLHRDVAVCDVAMITCVVNHGGSPPDGVLRLWPTRVRESPEQIRRDSRGAVDVRVRPGETVILLAGWSPTRSRHSAQAEYGSSHQFCYQAIPRDC